MASASAAAWCLLCDRPKVDLHYVCAAGSGMPEAPDLNARLRQAVLEECIVCVQELVTWRVNPTIQEPGIFGESPMSIATRKHHLAWSILQIFHTARMLEPYNSMSQVRAMCTYVISSTAMCIYWRQHATGSSTWLDLPQDLAHGLTCCHLFSRVTPNLRQCRPVAQGLTCCYQHATGLYLLYQRQENIGVPASHHAP